MSPDSDVEMQSDDDASSQFSWYETVANVFGAFRRYYQAPSNEPDEGITPGAEPAAPTQYHDRPVDKQDPLRPFGAPVTRWFRNALSGNLTPSFAPFINYSIFKVMWWQYTGSSSKSDAEMQRLVDKVILDPNFRKEELRGMSVRREKTRLDEFIEDGGDCFTPETGWRQAFVTLKLPKARTKYAKEEDIPTVTIGGIWVRDLLQMLVAGCKDSLASQFHWVPSAFARRSGLNERAERLHTDFWNSEAFVREYDKIRLGDREPEDPPDLEYVVVPLLVQSDSTRLATFGEASLWPIYVWFLNLSKYVRMDTAAFAAMHLAYVPHVFTRSNLI